MRIKLGLAKVIKHGAEVSGDSFELVERPNGGVTVILSRGQGNDAAAHSVGSLVANRAAALVSSGEQDDKISAAVHDYLYETSGKRAPCTLSLVSIDTAEETLRISRNALAPVLVKTPDFDAVYDDGANPIGLAKHSKPDLCELPITGETVAIAFTDGLLTMGKKHGHTPSTEHIMEIAAKNRPSDAMFIAESIAEYVVGLDKDVHRGGIGGSRRRRARDRFWRDSGKLSLLTL